MGSVLGLLSGKVLWPGSECVTGKTVWSLVDSMHPEVSPPEKPPARARGGRLPKYPWKQLAVDGSFFVRWYREESIQRLWNSLTSCKANAQRKTGFKFEMHRVPWGIRVWRVK